VKGVLLRRGLNVDLACPLCVDDIESSTHFFKDCPMTHKVWMAAAPHNWLPHSMAIYAYQDLQQFLSSLQYAKPAISKQKVTFLLWSIWKSRNTVVFRNDILNPLACLIQAKKSEPSGTSVVVWRLIIFLEGLLFPLYVPFIWCDGIPLP